MASAIVVIFDFDKTIIDVDSDNWVVDELGFTNLFNQLLHTMPWNSMMDKLMEEIHASGKTIQDIEEVLKRVPIHPRVVPAIRTAHSVGCDLRIVSDANVFFIDTILKHLGIRECFSEINTNPGYVDDCSRLRISPYHDFGTLSHGCNNPCPPNMCKGQIVERIQASLAKEGKKKRTIIYVGDGSGDFCAILKLKEVDFAMPKKNFPVWELISQKWMLVKGEIHEWTDGEELGSTLLQLIAMINTREAEAQAQAQAGEKEMLLLADQCKLQTMPLSAYKSFPPVLRGRRC